MKLGLGAQERQPLAAENARRRGDAQKTKLVGPQFCHGQHGEHSAAQDAGRGRPSTYCRVSVIAPSSNHLFASAELMCRTSRFRPEPNALHGAVAASP